MAFIGYIGDFFLGSGKKTSEKKAKVGEKKRKKKREKGREEGSFLFSLSSFFSFLFLSSFLSFSLGGVVVDGAPPPAFCCLLFGFPPKKNKETKYTWSFVSSSPKNRDKKQDKKRRGNTKKKQEKKREGNKKKVQHNNKPKQKVEKVLRIWEDIWKSGLSSLWFLWSLSGVVVVQNRKTTKKMCQKSCVWVAYSFVGRECCGCVDDAANHLSLQQKKAPNTQEKAKSEKLWFNLWRPNGNLQKKRKKRKKRKVWRNCPPNLSISLSGVKRK